MTNDELLRLITLQRQVEWQYQLDQFTNASLGQIKRSIDTVKNQVSAYITDRGESLTVWGAQRSEDILNEMNRLTYGIRGQLVDNISDISSVVGEKALDIHNDILSFGGRVAKFNTTMLSAAQLKSMVLNTPVGGNLLHEWVDKTFTTNLQTNIKEDLLAGMLRGKGYKGLIDGVEAGFDNIGRREAITLTRTYVQSANVGAMEQTYRANSDIVKKVKWSSTLESGYGGRGTCVRCACLDGEEFPIDDHPWCPLHPRCRCSLLPLTVSYRELGLDMDEIKDTYRPYTIRPSENIDVGQRKKILEVGFHDGDYASFYASKGKKFQQNVVGPVRQGLIADGEIAFKDLVNLKTGRLLTLEELGFTRGGGPLGGPGVPKVIISSVDILSSGTKEKISELGGGVNVTKIVEFKYKGKMAEGVFKPISGEASDMRFAINTEKLPQAYREVMASQIDTALDFNLVPKTILREIDGELGSVQLRISNFKCGMDFDPYMMDSEELYEKVLKMVSDKDIYKSGVFDWIIGNTDRHKENFLISLNDGKLHLIDNGLAFPTTRAKLKYHIGEWYDKIKSPAYPEDIAEAIEKSFTNKEKKDLIKKIKNLRSDLDSKFKKFDIPSRELVALKMRMEIAEGLIKDGKIGDFIMIKELNYDWPDVF